jgi:hypothetical protein
VYTAHVYVILKKKTEEKWLKVCAQLGSGSNKKKITAWSRYGGVTRYEACES